MRVGRTGNWSKRRGRGARRVRRAGDAHQQAIGGYLFRLAGDREVAFDLAQETFVRAYGALGRTRPGLQFKPWLYRIATNLASDRLRRRRIAWVSLHGVDRVVSAEPPGSVEERDLVRQTLARLRPDERAVLLLCGLERVSFPEAAAHREQGVDPERLPRSPSAGDRGH